MTKKYIVNEGGILGFQNPSEKISSEEFKLIKKEIDKLIAKQTPEQRLKNKLISLSYKMEDYLEKNMPESIVEVGQFIEELLNILGIKSKIFAEFMEVSKYDLSKIINGRKKLNNELAIKLGHFVNIKPHLWIAIQNKNEQICMEKEDSNKYEKYKFENFTARFG